MGGYGTTAKEDLMPDEIERQGQLAAEMILDSEGLTDDLEDAAAKHLLAWGIAQAKRLATERTDEDPERAVSSLRRLIKRVNNLVADRAELSDDEFAVELDELVALAGERIDLRAQGHSVTQSLLVERGHPDEAALVERITALLTPHESEPTS
jgi:hypothetical protein